MIRLLPFLPFLFTLVACSAPHVEDVPGDEQTQAWVPPAECKEITQIPCAVTIKQSCVEMAGCELSRLTIRAERGSSVNDIEPAARTRRAGYVDWLRGQAPHHVTVRDSVVNGRVFVGAGSTYVTLDRVVVLDGSPALYLAAETSRVRVLDSIIDGSHSTREAIAIDASDHFRLEGNTVTGDVFAYRNCGEEGRTRHTTPSDGRISRNEIDGDLVLGSREGDRWYCLEDYDSDGPGSAASDLDHSRRNVVDGNAVTGRVKQGKSARGNLMR